MNAVELECATRGAELLDNRWPGWWQEVDLSRLDLSDSCNCVLGQLGVDYNRAARQMLSINRDVTDDHYAADQISGYSLFLNVIFPDLGIPPEDMGYYGFDSDYEEAGHLPTLYEGLTAAWTRIISIRLVAREDLMGAMT